MGSIDIERIKKRLQFIQGSSLRNTLEAEWERARDFYTGRQTNYFYEDLKTNTKRDYFTFPIQINKITPNIQVLLSKLISMFPEPSIKDFGCVDPEKYLQIRAFNKYLKYILERNGYFRKLINDFSLYLTLYGTSAFYVYFDGDKDEIKIEVLPPQSFYVHPNISNYENHKYCFVSYKIDSREVENLIGIEVPEDTKAYFLKYYEVPSEQNKDGAYAELISLHGENVEGELYQVGDIKPFPYEFLDTIPVIFAPYLKVDDSVYGLSPVIMSVESQKFLNYSASFLLELSSRLCGKFVIRGSGVESGINSNPNEPIIIKGLADKDVLDYFTPPTPPASLITSLQMVSQHIDDSFGIYPIDRGEAPRSVRSGSQAELLLSASQLKSKAPLSFITEAIVNLSKVIFKISKSKYKNIKSKFVYFGVEYEVDFSKITEEDIGFDVGDVLPYGKTGIQSLIIQWYQQGVFGNPMQNETKISLWNFLQTAGLERFLRDIEPSLWTQIQEVELMITGKDVEVLDEDDHETHGNYLIHFMQSVEFRKLKPEIQEKIRKHFEEHKNKLREKMKGLIPQGITPQGVTPESIKEEKLKEILSPVEQSQVGAGPTPAPPEIPTGGE